MTDTSSMRRVFEDIYKGDQWTNGSGPGSHPDNTIEYSAFLARFIEANAIASVTDLGCGDWQFSRHFDWSRVKYVGYDIVPSIVERNRQSYGAPGIDFRVFEDIQALPGGDLLICKEVLQHLPNSMIADYLRFIAKAYRFSLFTNMIEPEELANSDIEVGGGRCLRLERAPFHAVGAIVFSYFPQRRSQFWKNGVFLIRGPA